MLHEQRTVVADPVAEHAGLDEAEETRMPCPVCRRTLIPASLAVAVRRVLRLLDRMATYSGGNGAPRPPRDEDER